MAAKRKAIGEKRRFELFKRDKFSCIYCGRTPPAVTLTVDHVIAVTHGGTDDDANLVTSCRECNIGKGDRGLDAIPDVTVDRIEDGRERMRQLKELNLFLMEVREFRERDVSTLVDYWDSLFVGKNAGLTASDIGSIRAFLKHLPAVTIADLMDVTFAKMEFTGGRRAFKYFCKCCWNTIKGEW